ncbi:MAG: caspase family protein [Alphaproteobacteria bacterium]|nr:caspase family protein [Alphaproteobacteria bacterium]
MSQYGVPVIDPPKTEEELWQMTKAAPTTWSLKNYLRGYPDGRYQVEAIALLKEAEAAERKLSPNQQCDGEWEVTLKRNPTSYKGTMVIEDGAYHFRAVADAFIMLSQGKVTDACIAEGSLRFENRPEVYQLFMRLSGNFGSGTWSGTTSTSTYWGGVASQGVPKAQANSGHFSGAASATKLRGFERAGAPSTDIEAEAESIFWGSVRDSGSAEQLRAYLRTYPLGKYASEAEVRLRALSGAQVAAAPGTAASSIAAKRAAPGSIRCETNGPQLVRVAPAMTTGLDTRPKLYVLSVGVSRYRDNTINLGFASKDACDLARVFAAQSGKLYREVEVRVLSDAQATREGILDGLDWIVRETTARDVAAVFMAGHGVSEGGKTYYFLPHDVDLGRISRTGVSQEEIRRGLANIPGKALYFFDTCHSGGLMQGTRNLPPDVSRVAQDLVAAGPGVIVYTAATGRQQSIERDDWSNGAFTKALLEGLAGAADFEKDGAITTAELDLYLAQRVKALTKGQQNPTTAKPKGLQDFPFFVAR